MRCVNAARYAVFRCPEDCLGVIRAGLHISKYAFGAYRCGLACHAPQEGHDLSARADAVGTEGRVARTACYAALGCPEDTLGVVNILALGVNVGEGIIAAADGAHAVFEIVAEGGGEIALEALRAAAALIKRVALLTAAGCDDGGLEIVDVVIVAFPCEGAAELRVLILAPLRAVCGVNYRCGDVRERLGRDGAVFAGYINVVDIRARGERAVIKNKAEAVERNGLYARAVGKCVFGDVQAVGAVVYNDLAQARAAGKCAGLDHHALAAVAVVIDNDDGLERRAAGKAVCRDLRKAGRKLGIAELCAAGKCRLAEGSHACGDGDGLYSRALERARSDARAAGGYADLTKARAAGKAFAAEDAHALDAVDRCELLAAVERARSDALELGGDAHGLEVFKLGKGVCADVFHAAAKLDGLYAGRVIVPRCVQPVGRAVVGHFAAADDLQCADILVERPAQAASAGAGNGHVLPLGVEGHVLRDGRCGGVPRAADRRVVPAEEAIARARRGGQCAEQPVGGDVRVLRAANAAACVERDRHKARAAAGLVGYVPYLADVIYNSVLAAALTRVPALAELYPALCRALCGVCAVEGVGRVVVICQQHRVRYAGVVYLDALGVLAQKLYEGSLLVAVFDKVARSDNTHAEVRKAVAKPRAAYPGLCAEGSLRHGVPLGVAVDYRAAAQHHDRRGQRALAVFALLEEHIAVIYRLCQNARRKHRQHHHEREQQTQYSFLHSSLLIV